MDGLFDVRREGNVVSGSYELECYERSVQEYLRSCKGYEEFDYQLKDVVVFKNLCNSGRSTENIIEAISNVCWDTERVVLKF